jgi:hypothetical protein
MSTHTYSGSCHCGALQFQVTAASQDGVFCHCIDCAKTGGCTPIAWAVFDDAQVRWIKGNPATYSSSGNGTRSFCGECGQLISFYDKRYPQDIDITMTSLEDIGDLKPSCHIWVQNKASWIKIQDDLPQYQIHRGAGQKPI